MDKDYTYDDWLNDRLPENVNEDPKVVGRSSPFILSMTGEMTDDTWNKIFEKQIETFDKTVEMFVLRKKSILLNSFPGVITQNEYIEIEIRKLKNDRERFLDAYLKALHPDEFQYHMIIVDEYLSITKYMKNL
jgi:hypothetical protein